MLSEYTFAVSTYMIVDVDEYEQNFTSVKIGCSHIRFLKLGVSEENQLHLWM